ncbi:MAG TPA: ribonuclease HII [Ktedonobacterales bacterium]|nr:ribonuclease HII [Ktedonobacterales bacterium]
MPSRKPKATAPGDPALTVPAVRITPTLEEEERLVLQGHTLIAGLDEAGRGCLAGPVVAAAAILPLADDCLRLFAGVRDSKQLSVAQRERLYAVVIERAVGVGVGVVSVASIDRYNILRATRLAMQQALSALPVRPSYLLLDALKLPAVSLPQLALIKGDARCLSIAAASIIAKVTRDRLMQTLDEQYPGYGFAQHKGYGTAEHKLALARLGPSPAHRRTFAPVRALLETQQLSLNL